MAQGANSAAGSDPGRIMALATGYWASQALLTANRLGVFAALADKGATAAELAASLALDERGARLLLDACTALGLLEKDGGGRYCNSDASATFLTPDSPASLANAIRYSDDLYATWGELEKAVRTGAPPMPPEAYLGGDPDRTRHFVYGMHDRALGIGRALTGLVDLDGRRRLLDVGGGPGTYSALLTARFDGLAADVLELEGVAAIAREILESMGAGERVTMRTGDYHATEFGSGYDVVLMSGMFHRESEASCRALIAKAHACLDAGGLLVVSDVFADAGGAGPEFATLFGLNMLLTAPDGGVHADADVADWLTEAGFHAVERTPFPPPMPHRVVSGSKR
ncbi:MAG: methyltransferase [Woeseiaceae bacterium]|nr:methyltransferase [Woeseiaceae bacterium]